MIDLVVKGGWVMAPILLGSVVALALVLERLWFFWSIRLPVEVFSEQIFALVKSGHLPEALKMCQQAQHPLAEVFKAGIQRAEEEPVQIERAMEREGNQQIQRLEKNLNILVMVVGVEPILGFLGTIVGLIQAFMAWEKYSTSVTVSTLAAGIYQAMITTAAGLIIAIPYFVIYHVFVSRVTTISYELNHYGDTLVGLLSHKKYENSLS